MVPQGCSLSPVAKSYLACLDDPVDGPLVGIPNGSQVLSKKYRLWARGTATSGDGTTTKDLAFLAQPYAMLTNDTNAVVFSGTAGPSSQTVIADMTGTPSAQANAPYDVATFNSAKISGRIVSWKFRIKYTGTALNKGGTIIGLQEPTHSTLAAATVPQLRAHTTSHELAIADLKKGQWYQLSYRPVDPLDTAFINSITPGAGAGKRIFLADNVTVTSNDTAFVAGYINVPVAQSTFLWEMYAVVEYTGANVPGKTINPPDPQGFACVLASFAQVDQMDPTSLHNAAKLGELGAALVAKHTANPSYNRLETTSNEQSTSWNWGTTAGQVAEIAYEYGSQLMSAAAPQLANAGIAYARRKLLQQRTVPRITEL